MKKDEEKILEVIFDWTKLVKKLETSSGSQDDLKQSLRIREEYLSNFNVTKVELFHKSPEYYSVKYFHNEKSYIKQFPIDKL